MHQTPAFDVALRPLRPAVVAPYGKARGLSWALIRSIVGTQTAARARPRGSEILGKIAGWMGRLVSERIPPGDLPDIAGAAAPPPVPLMPPDKITVGLGGDLAEWVVPCGSYGRQFLAFSAVDFPIPAEYADLIVTTGVRGLERRMSLVQQLPERAQHQPNRRAEIRVAARGGTALEGEEAR